MLPLWPPTAQRIFLTSPPACQHRAASLPEAMVVSTPTPPPPPGGGGGRARRDVGDSGNIEACDADRC